MLRNITSAFEPYQRFYAAESEKIERFAEKLGEDREGGAGDCDGSGVKHLIRLRHLLPSQGEKATQFHIARDSVAFSPLAGRRCRRRMRG